MPTPEGWGGEEPGRRQCLWSGRYEASGQRTQTICLPPSPGARACGVALGVLGVARGVALVGVELEEGEPDELATLGVVKCQ